MAGAAVYGSASLMADAELVHILDYILNRCDEAAIEAVSAAVIRRRRDLSLFGSSAAMPDPHRMARDLSSKLDMGLGAGLNNLTDMVRSMAVRIIKQEAPELTEAQIDELTRAWIPSGTPGGGLVGPGKDEAMPPDLLASMINQFISFSLGRMSPDEDQGLRADLGAWPERYWKAFPQVIQLIITDFLNGEMTEGEFNSRIGTAMGLYG
ncbi:hypothetical protein FACS189444_6570 [Spirochaetia bacterium]|nr:hypothetical protein FACS189444_6570 [Spirochaetia bacterium]